MITTLDAQELEAAFRKDLHALLEKYNGVNYKGEVYSTELNVVDEWRGYSECGQDLQLQVVIPSIYSPTGDLVRVGVEFSLGSWVNWDGACTNQEVPK